jgi:hypothetical protein
MSNCSCMEIAGEDPRCIRHGKGTQWAKENPDLCEISERLTTMQAREATLIRVLERAAENFERLTVPHIVGNDVHNFAFQAAKLIREALGTSGLVER